MNKMSNNEKINICFFSGDITRKGGTERVGTVVANELAKKQDYNISFLSLFEEKEVPSFFIHEKIRRHTLYIEKVSGIKHLLGYIRKIHKFVMKESIDILIDIDGILDMYSIPALIGTKTKLISWEQFNYYQNPYVNYRKYTRRIAARKADAIVVLTKEDKEYYMSNLKIKNMIKHIYNPIVLNDNANYNINSKNILSVGRMTEQKGFDYLVNVANIVLTKHPDWKWNLVGEGEEQEFLENRIHELKLQDKLILCGQVEHIESWYEKAGIYVMTSRYEGFGLVLTEAKSYHVPCVSFRCKAGPSEIILDEVNGYLIDCFDIKKMAEKICDLIENEEKRMEFSNRSLEDTEKYSIDNVMRKWEELFRELISDIQ